MIFLELCHIVSKIEKFQLTSREQVSLQSIDEYQTRLLVVESQIQDPQKFKSPQYIRNFLKENIKVLGKNGGFIPGPTNTLLDHSPENIVTLFKAIQEFGKY